MALATEELIAVIAGSLVGLIILLAVVAAVLYFCVGRRRKNRRRYDQKPFPHHHLTPDTSLSKNSGHQHGDKRIPDPRMDPRQDPRADPRLPKVGSSNLWFGTPSLYSGGPAPIYQDMKRKTSGNRVIEQPALQAAPGHMVYQSGNLGRIYHSQQVAMYEPNYRVQRTGSYMDLYSYGNPYNYDPYRDITNSRAMLVEYPDYGEYFKDPYRERETRRTGKKVQRSQSDVTQHSTRRPKNKRQRGQTPFEKEGRSSSKSHDLDEKPRGRSQSSDRVLGGERTTVAEVHKPKKKAPAPPKPKPDEDVYIHSLELTDPEIPQSATDSAKLRAIEREKERNREKEALSKPAAGLENLGYVVDDNNEELHIKLYNYEGKPSKYESSVVAKMAAMTETPKATYVTRQNITESSPIPQAKDKFHEEVSKRLARLQDGQDVKLDKVDGPQATSTGKHSRSSRPTSARGRRSSGLTDQDGNVITAEAFGFLDGYSDGEGTDFLGSGSLTPTEVRDNDIAF